MVRKGLQVKPVQPVRKAQQVWLVPLALRVP